MYEPQTFGNYLRSERELRQVPLPEISAATKIPLQTLESLECGDWEDLPATVFVRGFIRSYARHIGLPANDACLRYDEVLGALHKQQEPAVESVGEAAAVMGLGRRRFGLALFVIIILIIATITISLFWRRGASAETHALLEQQTHPAASLRCESPRPADTAHG